MTQETTEISKSDQPPEARHVPATGQEATGAGGQRAMQVAALIEDQTEVSKRERAKTAVNAREQKAGRQPILGAAASTKIESPERVRPTAAAKAGISERKVRKAQFVRKAAPALAAKVEARLPSPDDPSRYAVFVRPHCPNCNSKNIRSYGTKRRGRYSQCRECFHGPFLAREAEIGADGFLIVEFLPVKTHPSDKTGPRRKP
jgi:hypothetical protein